ncbi:hypothetical protein RchiOBHm_Chr5g0043911 [Rosa chinensis]|uniref:Uncharacterized protein n=1 Tax=Rosa chinensis TaxID=74649 RepID=A0A2P6QDH6_ROSCH|nr:hypothetical protein RchiOBHm_Chr5g0043911 [Rosa chinensis]
MGYSIWEIAKAFIETTLSLSLTSTPRPSPSTPTTQSSTQTALRPTSNPTISLRLWKT